MTSLSLRSATGENATLVAKKATGLTRKREPFKDVTNVRQAAQPGRVRKFSKPTKATKRQADEASAMEAETVAQRVHKKRKSEPESDPMLIDEDITAVATKVEIPHDDIDLYDYDDPQSVTEYVDDIYAYMRHIEVRCDYVLAFE